MTTSVEEAGDELGSSEDLLIRRQATVRLQEDRGKDIGQVHGTNSGVAGKEKPAEKGSQVLEERRMLPGKASEDTRGIATPVFHAANGKAEICPWDDRLGEAVQEAKERLSR